MSIKYLALALLVVANCSAEKRDPRNIGVRESQYYRNGTEEVRGEYKGYERDLEAARKAKEEAREQKEEAREQKAKECEQKEESLVQSETDSRPSADGLKVLREERKQKEEESIEEKKAKQDKELVDKLRLGAFALILATFYQQSEPGVMSGIGIAAGLAGIAVGNVCFWTSKCKSKSINIRKEDI